MPTSIPPVGADARVTLAAKEAVSHIITAIYYSYSAQPVGGRLTIVDDATTKFDQDITAGGSGAVNISISSDAPNTAMTVTLFAGGPMVQGKLVVQSYDAG